MQGEGGRDELRYQEAVLQVFWALSNASVLKPLKKGLFLPQGRLVWQKRLLHQSLLLLQLLVPAKNQFNILRAAT